MGTTWTCRASQARHKGCTLNFRVQVSKAWLSMLLPLGLRLKGFRDSGLQGPCLGFGVLSFGFMRLGFRGSSAPALQFDESRFEGSVVSWS